MQNLKIIEVIGSPNAIIQKQGLKVFEAVKGFLESGQQVTLSFSDVQNVTSGFCNASIGNIYKHFPDKADSLLILKDYESITLMEKKIAMAKELGKNPDKARENNNVLSDLLTE